MVPYLSMDQCHGCFDWCRQCLRNITTSDGEQCVLIMHRPRRSFEMVLQEACIQHHSVETMRDIHHAKLSTIFKNDAINNCDNYYSNNNSNNNNNNNNNNNDDFLPAAQTIIHDDLIRLPALVKVSENLQNQNIQRIFL
ncbi:hypothetical protein ACH3XW_0555 [Acanthocheilonema viteae]